MSRPTLDLRLDLTLNLTLNLTLLAALSAALHLRAEYFGPQYQVYVFKPLTMGLILLIAWRVRNPVAPRYQRLVIAGLVCSLAGDVLLMLPVDLFVPGLLCFLCAHLVYIVAFRLGVNVNLKSGLSWRSSLPFVGYGALIFGFLAPGLGEMLLPVLAYVVVIMLMAWQAWRRWDFTRQRAALLAFVGALFFVLSDSALAVNRFRTAYGAAPALILGTYFVAQWLIARSVEGDAPA